MFGGVNCMAVGRVNIAGRQNIPSQATGIIYNGSEQSPTWTSYDSEFMTVSGDLSAVNAGIYTVVFMLKSGNEWADGTKTSKIVAWSIERAVTSEPTLAEGDFTYDGTVKNPIFNNLDPAKVNVAGENSATDAGDYTATLIPTNNYQWADGTTVGKSVSWTIKKLPIDVFPSQSSSLSYNGTVQSPAWNNYDSNKMTIGGTTSAADVGTYVATFTPTNNYKWSDGSPSISVSWSIGKYIVAVPTQGGTLSYNGTTQEPSWNNYDTERMNISGTTNATSVGSYTAIFSLTDTENNQWSDGTIEDKMVSWTISKISVTVPTQNGTLTYTGSAQSPAWAGYNNTIMNIGGDTMGTDAGEYDAIFTLNDTANYKWPDGSTTPKNVTWTIDKQAPTVTLSSTSASVILDGTTDVVVTKNSGGEITAVSDNTDIATVSVSGNVLTITGVAVGDTTITINIAEDANYGAYSVTLSVSAIDIPENLADCPLSKISELSAAGTLQDYFDVGDEIDVLLNGKCGPKCTLDNVAIRAFIIGFNHNAEKEGNGLTHFLIGKINNVDICLCYAQMNNGGTNNDGWNGSVMRNTYLGQDPSNPPANSLMAALPAALRAVLKPVTKYTSNVGTSHNLASAVTATTDYLFLLSEFEVFGGNDRANRYERYQQEQYQYYKDGNSKIAYRHDDQNSVYGWWLRSPHYISMGYFCFVSSSGKIFHWIATEHCAPRPGFCL